MNIDLSNKHILVTGASRGIGMALAEAVGKAGARVAVHYNKAADEAEKLVKEIGNKSQAFHADLENPLECAGLFKLVKAAFGHIDVLINNAGVYLQAPLEEKDTWTRVWDYTMAVNLRAAGILCREAVLHFQTRKTGRIINIASRSAFRGDSADYMAYAASKGGMVALSRTIARQFGKDGITSFVVAPGWVRSDMTNSHFEEFGEENVLKELALDRITEPRDISPVVTLLASGLADHSSGTTIDVNAASYVH